MAFVAITRGTTIGNGHRLAIDLQVGRRDAATAVDEREAERLTLCECDHAGLLDCADVNEHVLAAVITHDKAETLLRVEELYDASAFADNLRGHATTGATAAAAATKAAATAAVSTAATAAAAEAITAAAEAAAAAVAAATAAAIAAAAAEPVAAAAEAAAAAEIVAAAAEAVTLVAATPATVPAATFIETHKP
jgi:hypothetical protein